MPISESLTIADDDTSFVVNESMLVKLTRLDSLKSGVVGGQPVVLGALSAMPERDHAPHHRLNDVRTGFGDGADLETGNNV